VKGPPLSEITLDQVRATAKPRDAWWTVLLVDPVAIRLVRWWAPHKWITPNRVTMGAFALGLAAAAAFWQGTRWWLVVGALLYHVSFILDCVDGKLARVRGTGSVFGVWLDFIFDRLLVVICAVALMGGQYALTHQAVYLVLGGAVVVLNLFRQVNGQTMQSARRAMERQLEAVRGETKAGRADPDSFSQLSSGVRARLGPFLRVRALLARHRIRADLISGIEFQMGVFIVGPLIGQVLWTTVVFAALLLAFEFAMILQFWLAIRSFNRRLARAREKAPAVTLPVQVTPSAAADASSPIVNA
jgi:phosphatidylglycerophosphate synthase